jgi:hypothetical protein
MLSACFVHGLMSCPHSTCAADLRVRAAVADVRARHAELTVLYKRLSAPCAQPGYTNRSEENRVNCSKHKARNCTQPDCRRERERRTAGGGSRDDLSEASSVSYHAVYDSGSYGSSDCGSSSSGSYDSGSSSSSSSSSDCSSY